MTVYNIISYLYYISMYVWWKLIVWLYIARSADPSYQIYRTKDLLNVLVQYTFKVAVESIFFCGGGGGGRVITSLVLRTRRRHYSITIQLRGEFTDRQFTAWQHWLYCKQIIILVDKRERHQISKSPTGWKYWTGFLWMFWLTDWFLLLNFIRIQQVWRWTFPTLRSQMIIPIS